MPADHPKTKERLAAALREAGAPAGMVRDAESGKFDDFESESNTPIRDLVAMCSAYGLPGIAARARAGEFDGTREEADAWAAAQVDPEMVALLRKLRQEGGEDGR